MRRNTNLNGENVYTLPSQNVNRVSTDEEALNQIKAIVSDRNIIPHRKIMAFEKVLGLPRQVWTKAPKGSLKALSWDVWKKTGGFCIYCGQMLNPFTRNDENGFHIDHVKPRSKGGSDALRNLVPSCFSCNNDKRDTPIDQWRGA
jgi:hypothetical protein